MGFHGKILVSIAPMLRVMSPIRVMTPQEKKPLSTIPAVGRSHRYRYQSSVMLIITLAVFLTVILMLVLFG